MKYIARGVRISDEQKNFLNENCLNLSAITRQLLDSMIDNNCLTLKDLILKLQNESRNDN